MMLLGYFINIAKLFCGSFLLFIKFIYLKLIKK
jgi:hypothetical protein